MSSMWYRDSVLSMAVALVLFAGNAFSAQLVAAWPLDDGPAGTPVTGANDIIDAGLTFQDATTEGSGHTWSNDPLRGVVYNTTEDSRLNLGTQGINLTNGFTWSVWVKTDGNQQADGGADVIIGSRSGVWNKFQVTGLNRWVDVSGYNVDDAVWHHCVIVGTNDPRVSVYIDGLLVGSDTTLFNDTWIVNDKFELGGSSTFGEDIAGAMSDVGVWSNALSEGEIVGLYNLSNQTNLLYKVYDAEQLFGLYRSQSSSPIEVQGTKWYYDASLINNATNDGALFDLGSGNFELCLDSSADSGVTTMNPAGGMVLIIR